MADKPGRAAPAGGATVVPLAWDSTFFGFPIACIEAERPDRRVLTTALRECRSSGVRCVYLLLDADDDRGSEAAQSLGFIVRDVRVELDRPVDADEARARDASAAVTRADAQHLAALEALARERFTMSRFFADPGFPRERCQELYAAFVRRGLSDAPRRWTLTNADASGCIVCHSNAEQGLGTIELVAARHRGDGIALVRAAIASFARAGLRCAVVATQVQNIAAQRSYQRAGFRSYRSALWLHCWLD